MKYPSLGEKPRNTYTYTIADFDCGINDESGEYADQDNILSECNNMYFENGVLKTREGFCAKQNSVIRLDEYHDTVYLPFTVSDTVYFKNDKPYNLAYCCIGDVAEAYLNFYLVDTKGDISPAGNIYIHRVDEQTFNLPKNVFFAIADKIDGIGVFAYVKRGSNGENIYDIYEARANFSEWVTANGNIYMPTVRIYGRGERYDEADGYVNLNYPEPERPEELNLLNGKYRCFFSSDGLSSIFRLPYGNLNPNYSVKCRIYSSSEEYTEWTVEAYVNNNTQTIEDKSVTLYLNRTLGTLSFYEPGDVYHVPVMRRCKHNNIMVIATTLDEIADDSIISSTGAVSLNNRLYFYGNDNRKNCIYCANMANPLYIPQSSRLYIGDSSTPVTSLRVQNGKLIAFKSGETYRIITNALSDEVRKETVLPESTIYMRGDTMSAQTIDNGIGCISDKTVRLCGSRLVFMGSDRNIYALATTTYGNTTNIYCVSKPLGERLKNNTARTEDIFAVTKDGKYLLFAKDEVFVMNYRVRGFGYSRTYYAQDDKLKSPAWFRWRIPEGAPFYTGAQTASAPLVLSSFDNNKAFYITTLSGEEDSVITKENDAEKIVRMPIKSEFKTKLFELGDPNRLKRIDCIFISGKSEGDAKLTLLEGGKGYSYPVSFREDAQYMRIGTGIPFCGGAGVSVTCEKPFSIRSVVLKYKTLADKG